MSYDGVVTCAMTQELKRELTLGKIEKIYQPQPDQLLLSVHTARGRRKLFISASGNHSAVYLTENNPENPVQPPLFCMVLRKQLETGRIAAILIEIIIDLKIRTVGRRNHIGYGSHGIATNGGGCYLLAEETELIHHTFGGMLTSSDLETIPH